MAIIKILKNTSGADKQILNTVVASAASMIVPTHLWLELAQDASIEADITLGQITVNNGVIDLSVTEGIELIKRFQFDSANKISFDNTSNDFIANNVQDAIEEAQNTAIAFSRFTICCTFNGTVGNNQWLGYNEVLPGNQVPIRIPIKCRIREISFSYNQNNILGIPVSKEQIDGVFRLYKNGLTNPTDVIHTETFTNQAGGKIVTGLVINILQGDYIVGRWTDAGDNPSDMAITYFFEPTQ